MEKRIAEILKELGVPVGNLGFKYLITAIESAANNDGEVGAITKYLYPMIAQKYKSKSTRVERCIRHAVELAYKNTDSKTWFKYFGNGMQTNRNFIAALAYHIITSKNKGGTKHVTK